MKMNSVESICSGGSCAVTLRYGKDDYAVYDNKTEEVTGAYIVNGDRLRQYEAVMQKGGDPYSLFDQSENGADPNTARVEALKQGFDYADIRALGAYAAAGSLSGIEIGKEVVAISAPYRLEQAA